jgi:hypothetical protein
MIALADIYFNKASFFRQKQSAIFRFAVPAKNIQFFSFRFHSLNEQVFPLCLDEESTAEKFFEKILRGGYTEKSSVKC